ncbi:hypothetical protein Tco_0823644 [Tanacetum coccineum]|uniref:Uncharacterized protein n=1 Tax=Tanacetum coccineum TaxID=301880 RepID=A0ABQ5AIL1_9ASTR
MGNDSLRVLKLQVSLLELNRFEILLDEWEGSQAWQVTVTGSRLLPVAGPLFLQFLVRWPTLLQILHLTVQGWAKEFHQDRASSVNVPVANFTLQSSVQLLQENADSVLSN